MDSTTHDVGTADNNPEDAGKELAKPGRSKSAREKPAPKKAPSEKEMKALSTRAEQIREHDQGILKAQKSSMSTALAAGELLLWGKQELKKIGVKKKFQAWIEADCKVEYKRAYNYMRLVQAVAKDASIKNLGLTEAYLRLRLVTRKMQE
jgi:hypothetical protein